MLQSSQQNRRKEVPGSRSQVEGPPAGGGARHRQRGGTDSFSRAKQSRQKSCPGVACPGWMENREDE